MNNYCKIIFIMHTTLDSFNINCLCERSLDGKDKDLISTEVVVK